ncbi:hypothetical protein F5B22DRAFT_548551 [Xylaria bambusicola]|uniref:uncharacterized protein n=1 Tax=Xylaria bambusicola TaxID=326684 RepID=UPI0020082D05|nr:uncharacterized protein F5B22DRAFT_548551 [Xylaria bambusicola]KAI0521728.1 hypothetical protein F5B22DRAFT_548551 [Xylaria bambusicola]
MASAAPLVVGSDSTAAKQKPSERTTARQARGDATPLCLIAVLPSPLVLDLTCSCGPLHLFGSFEKPCNGFRVESCLVFFCVSCLLSLVSCLFLAFNPRPRTELLLPQLCRGLWSWGGFYSQTPLNERREGKHLRPLCFFNIARLGISGRYVGW